MPPGHVFTLEDYWLWLDRIINESGGWLEDAALVVDCYPGNDDPPELLVVQPQRIMFWGAFLQIAFVVDRDFSLPEYSFHFQEAGGGIVWRLDKHEGNSVGLCHIHVDDVPHRAQPCDEVDLEEVLNRVQDHLTPRAIPPWKLPP